MLIKRYKELIIGYLDSLSGVTGTYVNRFADITYGTFLEVVRVFFVRPFDGGVIHGLAGLFNDGERVDVSPFDGTEIGEPISNILTIGGINYTIITNEVTS